MAANATATAGPVGTVDGTTVATDPAPVGHHFYSLGQQQDSVRLGIWLFLVTEVLFFGGAMCAYTAYRIWFPNEFATGSAALNVGIATVNTFLLLASSLTVTLAVRACYDGRPKGVQMWLGLTIILGTLFLGLKAREYMLDYEEGLIPNKRLMTEVEPGVPTVVDEGMDMPQAPKYQFVHNLEEVLHHAGHTPKPGVDLFRVQLFFMFYYIMTGLHVIHMIVGIGLLGWQFVMAKFGFFRYPARYVYIEALALYWHFVDIVWIFLLPLLYLAGPHDAGQVVTGLEQAFGIGH